MMESCNVIQCLTVQHRKTACNIPSRENKIITSSSKFGIIINFIIFTFSFMKIGCWVLTLKGWYENISVHYAKTFEECGVNKMNHTELFYIKHALKSFFLFSWIEKVMCTDWISSCNGGLQYFCTYNAMSFFLLNLTRFTEDVHKDFKITPQIIWQKSEPWTDWWAPLGVLSFNTDPSLNDIWSWMKNIPGAAHTSNILWESLRSLKTHHLCILQPIPCHQERNHNTLHLSSAS